MPSNWEKSVIQIDSYSTTLGMDNSSNLSRLCDGVGQNSRRFKIITKRLCDVVTPEDYKFK